MNETIALIRRFYADVVGGRITGVGTYHNLEDWLAQVRRIDVD